MVQNRVDGRVHFIIFIEKHYHNENNCKVFNFSDIKIKTNLTQNMIHYQKKNDHKVSYFPGLKIVTNIPKTDPSALAQNVSFFS